MWVQDTYKSKSRAFSLGQFADCFRASDGLLVVFLWSALYSLWCPGVAQSPARFRGEEIQNAFKKIYRREETVRQDKKIGRWDQAGGGPAEWIKGCKFRVLVVRGSVGFRPGP